MFRYAKKKKNHEKLIDLCCVKNKFTFFCRIIGYHLPSNVTSKSEKELNVLSSLLGVKSVQNLLNMTFCEVRKE